jgi:hypothetical protein
MHRRHIFIKIRSIYIREIYEEEVKEKFELMINYKYPTIASGATLIGSVERAPDEP